LEFSGVLFRSLELLPLALPDRDEVDDHLDPLYRPAQARQVGDVALRGLLAADPGLPPRTGFALQYADPVAGVDDRIRHRRPDEAGRSCDEDLHLTRSRKFCQYLLGVGPCCPWSCEPSSPEP